MKVINVEGGKPIFSWAGDEVEAGALEQATNLARLPFVIDHVALMPDAHQGYGMPIGGVLFADKAVVPNAVGVDIGCGVVLIETDLLIQDIDAATTEIFLNQVARDVPVGNGPGGGHRTPTGEPFVGGPRSDVADMAIKEADLQLGTLGGGNHFLELQADDHGRIWFMLHSGSRSVGKKICDHWHRVALQHNRRWASILPHDELAWLPWETDEAQGYYQDQLVALSWAEENRRRMAGAVIAAFGKVWQARAWQVLDVHHNYVTWERHFGRDGLVHRKGAVRAKQDEIVLIPGSMSTGSYVAVGMGNPVSFNTCQHGAGRARSRAATRKLVSLAQMESQLRESGVILVTPSREKVIDESQDAYKDIENVMASSLDLVESVRRHRPLGVVKG